MSDPQPTIDPSSTDITFQLYRLDLGASTIAELQGERLAELVLDGSTVSGEDTVATVKQRILPSFQAHVNATDRVTLYFTGRRMQDDALFFADHFMLLPAWVQVLLHDGAPEDVEAAVRRLKKQQNGQ